MTRDEKKQILKIFRSLKTRYGHFDGIIFGFDFGICRTIEEFPIGQIKELGMISEDNTLDPNNTYIVKLSTMIHNSLLYISNEPINFIKAKVYKTEVTKDTRDALYCYDIELGEKDVYPLPLGLMVKEGNSIIIPADKDCHLDKRPVIK